MFVHLVLIVAAGRFAKIPKGWAYAHPRFSEEGGNQTLVTLTRTPGYKAGVINHSVTSEIGFFLFQKLSCKKILDCTFYV